MPKKQKETAKQVEEVAVENAVVEEQVEEPVVPKKEQAKQNGNSYEVAPAFKQYSSFLLAGGVVIPVKDGKVTVASNEVVSKLREGGFIK